MPPTPLKFIVAPHIVQDLGLNLYTDLPRVLVEFVANAYDADSPFADIRMDINAIADERSSMRLEYRAEKERAKTTGKDVGDLETRTLPANFKIIIEDAGHGMSRADLGSKFLVAGRRRLQEDTASNGRSPEGRPLMGRKGLGKLAGFGVARTIEVISRKKGEQHATRIVLDYDDLLKYKSTDEIEIPDEVLEDGGGFDSSGTKIILSRLLYDPVKSRAATIETQLAEHFDLIKPEEFEIRINGNPLTTDPREHAYAWPSPELPVGELVERSLTTDVGESVSFRYRMRFTGENQALQASRRGVRVYVNKRLAAAPSLLQADTNMHGFRMTDYLDGVVHADFIAEEDVDYIATDRQSLRWDAPLLSKLNAILSEEIKEACKQYQRKRDKEAPDEVREDYFTRTEIKNHHLSKKDETLAYRIAAALKTACKRGLNDPIYKEKLPSLLRGIGHGNILAAISELAEEEHPELAKVAVEVANLAKDELDQFASYVKTRIKAIAALKKIVKNADFKKNENEKVIQQMLERSPWLVDPTYSQFLSGDKPLLTVFDRLAKTLKIGTYATSKKNKKRPDLVFLLGNEGARKLVIVELKSANTPLRMDHLSQLKYYMARAEKWLEQNDHSGIHIQGELIGTFDSDTSIAEGHITLMAEINKAGPSTAWRVRDYLKVLEDTESAHIELLSTYDAEDDGLNSEDRSSVNDDTTSQAAVAKSAAFAGDGANSDEPSSTARTADATD